MLESVGDAFRCRMAHVAKTGSLASAQPAILGIGRDLFQVPRHIYSSWHLREPRLGVQLEINSLMPHAPCSLAMS